MPSLFFELVGSCFGLGVITNRRAADVIAMSGYQALATRPDSVIGFTSCCLPAWARPNVIDNARSGGRRHTSRVTRWRERFMPVRWSAASFVRLLRTETTPIRIAAITGGFLGNSGRRRMDTARMASGAGCRLPAPGSARSWCRERRRAR